jgi:hypothetical protein
MEFSKSVIDLIQERTSWRTYFPELLDSKFKNMLTRLLKSNEIRSPFDSGSEKCRFELISVPEFDPEEQKQLGTHGMISGAQEFIVGASTKSEHYKENFGYLLEMIILKATDLGLGTCWLGGTFNRTIFSTKINCQDGEVVPAITPIGYPAKRRTREKIIRRVVRAKSRKPWSDIFFMKNFQSPLTEQDLGEFKTVLEMVRLGPSAGNKQPWRIIKDDDFFHLYVKYPEGKMAVYRPFVRLDMGIATCHFDLVTKELDIKGEWRFDEPAIESQGLKYIISWHSI